MTPIARLFSLIISAAIVVLAIPVLFGIGVIALGFVLVTSLVAGIAARIMIKRNPDIAKSWQARYAQTPYQHQSPFGDQGASADKGAFRDKGPVIEHE